MKRLFLFVCSLCLWPLTSQAQATVNTTINGLITFFGNVVVPFLIGIAFLFFLINVVRYFVIESTNEDGREKARKLATYGVAAFVLIVIFWGLINLLVNSIGLGGEEQSCPDYMEVNGACLPPCPPGVITGPCAVPS